MARCPFAVWRPLPDNSSEPGMTPRVFIFHTMVGSLRGTETLFRRPDFPIESHFGVGCPKCGEDLDGVIWQWIDTNRTADANLKANSFAISVETCDHGDPNRPWSPKQIASLVRLGDWAARTHGINRRQVPAWDSNGFGWHVLFGAPGPWTPVAKTCPGAVRIDQLKRTVLPAIFAGTAEEDDMAALFDNTKEFESAVERAVDHIMSQGLTGDRNGAMRAWAAQLDQVKKGQEETAELVRQVLLRVGGSE